LVAGASRTIEAHALTLGVFAGGALYWFDESGHVLHPLDLASAQRSDFMEIEGRALASAGVSLYFAKPCLRRSSHRSCA
jgi:hypothetical protein